MAFKSHAQREKMEQFVKDGRITQAQFDEMAKDTPKDLPHRTEKKPGKSKEKPLSEQGPSDW